MSVCQNCINAKSNGGQCIEALATDGHYTWGTPLNQGDPLLNHVDVWNSLSKPELDEAGNPRCFNFKPK